MQQCHLCKYQYCQSNKQQQNSQLQSQPQSQSIALTYLLPKCCIKRCNKKYCISCIRQKFDISFQQQMYKADTWICYSCQKLCACTICKGIDNQKKGTKKKIGSVISNKQQTKNQLEKQIIIEDYYGTQQISSSPPFMKKMLQRRNHMYKLMVNAQNNKNTKQALNSFNQKQKDSIRTEQKPNNNIKKLINSTLKNYGNDQNDIQLID